MATAIMVNDDRPPMEFGGEDPDVPRLIGHSGERLKQRPIRKARMREMRGGPNRVPAARFSAEPKAPTPREVAALSIRQYDAAWARIAAWKGGAA